MELAARPEKATRYPNGSSGILEHDDTENWINIIAATRGAVGRRALSVDYSMGLGREVTVGDFPGPGRVLNTKFQEANSRAFFRRWRELVLSTDSTCTGHHSADVSIRGPRSACVRRSD